MKKPKSRLSPKKRNCGRTGPASPEGRAAPRPKTPSNTAPAPSFFPTKSEADWDLLFARWLKTYQPAEDSLLYDFVLKTAPAEWHRIRTQLNYDCCRCMNHGPTFNWPPDDIKKYELALRYKNSAERAFQREYRHLKQHYKLHPPTVVKELPAKEPAPEESPKPEILRKDPESPSTMADQYATGRREAQPPDDPVTQSARSPLIVSESTGPH